MPCTTLLLPHQPHTMTRTGGVGASMYHKCSVGAGGLFVLIYNILVLVFFFPSPASSGLVCSTPVIFQRKQMLLRPQSLSQCLILLGS